MKKIIFIIILAFSIPVYSQGLNQVIINSPCSSILFVATTIFSGDNLKRYKKDLAYTWPKHDQDASKKGVENILKALNESGFGRYTILHNYVKICSSMAEIPNTGLTPTITKDRYIKDMPYEF